MAKSLTPIHVDTRLELQLHIKAQKEMQVMISALNKEFADIYSNSIKDLYDAIVEGEVRLNGKHLQGNITREIATEIRKLGGVYDAKSNSYEFVKVPSMITEASDKSMAIATKEAKKALSIIDNIIAKTYKTSDYVKEFVNIIDQVVFDTKQSIAKVKSTIGLTQKYTPSQIEIIAQRYSKNLKRYIKKFQVEQIQKIRKDIMDNIEKGGRPERMRKVLQNEYGISARKAKSLARQESNLCAVAQKFALYNEADIKKFRWLVHLDNKVRHDHKILDNKIFLYDAPPITNHKTGARNLPGEDFNCRCIDQPLV